MLTRHHRMLALLVFPLGLTLATTALGAPGVRMGWDRCAADGRVANRFFACDTNAGSELLVGSFEPEFANTHTGLEVTIDVFASETTIPAWWQFKNIGSCRRLSLQWMTSPPPGPSACVDAFQGQALGGIGAYNSYPYGTEPDRMRLLCATAVPAEAAFTVTPGVEYFAFG